MTAASTATALHHFVSDPNTQAALRAYARRRGLREEVDDVVQSALCAAVAAPNVPSDPEVLPRWVHGILRRKVADVFRQRRRWPGAELPELATAPRAFEARELLQRIHGDVLEPKQRSALCWLLREHAGESLLEIARQEAVSPENLRQRICRLRRYLRAQYLVPLAVLVAFGASAWQELPLDAGSDAALLAPAAQPFAGRWRVERVTNGDDALIGLVVELGPSGVVLKTPEGVAVKRFELVQAAEGLYLTSGERRWHLELTELSSGGVEVTSDKGNAVLRRLP